MLTRALIAWLHLLQPIARARGAVRGMLMSPEIELAHDRSMRMLAPWEEIGDALAFFRVRRDALRFWSEAWLSRETLLTRMVDRFRSTRIGAALEVDDGWDPGRDVSLQLGRWARLDVQLLIEEHAFGKVLVRIARRVNVTPFFAASVAAAIGLIALSRTPVGPWSVFVPAVVVVAMMLRALWHGAATLVLADRVMTKVLLEVGAVPLGTPATQVATRLRNRRGMPARLSLERRSRPRDPDEAAAPPAPVVPTARHAG
jgi:hypothetical protein